jgi:trans-aconitate 2-methyltransferase
MHAGAWFHASTHEDQMELYAMTSVGHEWNADDYANNSEAQLQWAEELIAKLSLKGFESVIDIGCGDGKITARLASIVKDGHVLGIDSSESMIQLASAQFPASSIRNLSFCRMDATEISLPREFDIAFSNAVLHWVRNQTSVLRGVRSCLKTGGKLLFQMGGRGNAAEIFDTIGEVVNRPEWQQYYKGFKKPYCFHGPDEYNVWLRENCFQPIHVELIPKDMKHKGVEGLEGWLRTTWFPYTDRLPAELREIFLREIVETYLAMHPVDSLGNTHVRMVRLEVEAYAI